MTKFKVGQKVKSLFHQTKGEIGEIIAVTNGVCAIKGFSDGSPAIQRGCFNYSDDNLELIEEVQLKEVFEIGYEEPIEDEFTENCLSTCKPGDHKCKK